jgi:hypothetical protein
MPLASHYNAVWITYHKPRFYPIFTTRNKDVILSACLKTFGVKIINPVSPLSMYQTAGLPPRIFPTLESLSMTPSNGIKMGKH